MQTATNNVTPILTVDGDVDLRRRPWSQKLKTLPTRTSGLAGATVSLCLSNYPQLYPPTLPIPTYPRPPSCDLPPCWPPLDATVCRKHKDAHPLMSANTMVPMPMALSLPCILLPWYPPRRLSIVVAPRSR